ncbi:MAG: hypothetical protein IPO69_16050 [Saprospiraceae bacterium]|nr:hypothetical protein [Saprospiraceae bacterium]
MLVPQGTKLSWQIDAENTDHVMMSFGATNPKKSIALAGNVLPIAIRPQ